jgi:hypothetical protein
MNLLGYVPSALEVNECIKPEAEGVSEAILLAVHCPSKLVYRFVNRSDTIPTNEQELLDHVLSHDVPTGALVVPITGISGVGKSHLVRILNARLRQRGDANRFLIVRIPKSASLRRVVQLILELLPNEPRFAEVHTAFDRAMAQVEMESATVDFAGCLMVALEQRAKLLSERYTNGETGLGPELDHTRRVHLLFQDPVTGEHFRQSIFPRILKRAIRAGNPEDVDVLGGQFTPKDLVLPPAIKLGEASVVAQKYYTLAINQGSGNGRETAAKVLNDVVDEATRRLFKLHDSLGGMTLQEVILEIRRLLLEQNKELILLIEDFAALTGIQETLSKVLIQEGVRDGEQVYATMRSVIAVTDGWTIGRETIATRAEREWIIQSQIDSEEEVLALTQAMVAAYLNAARHGHANLIKYYRESKQRDASRWLDVYRSDQDDDATAKLLAAFGDEASIPLFPFTSLAIVRLARIALTEGQRLIFRPRYIINQILRNTLLTARELFKENNFPPTGLDPREPSAAIADVIQSQPESVRERYSTVLTVWGNAPQDVSALSRIPAGVYEAFNLPVPKNVEFKRDTGAERRPVERKTTSTSAVERRADPKVLQFQSALETWIQQSQRLPQEHAAKIRNLVADVLNQYVDLNAERCREISISSNQISIPNAAGEQGLVANPIIMAADAKDRDGRTRRALVALYRINEAQKSKDVYPEYAEDLARVSNFVDGLMPQALTFFRSRALEQCTACAIPLAMSARVLGIGDVNKSPHVIRKALVQAIEERIPLETDEGDELTDWRVFQADCRATRSMLRSKLLRSSGCFQGTGQTVLAVDIVRVTTAYNRSLVSTEDRVTADLFTADEIPGVRSLAEPKVRHRANGLLNTFRSVSQAIESGLGGQFDKNAVLTAVGELADMLKKGNWDTDKIGVSYPAFSTLCDSFRACAVKEALHQFNEASGDDQTGTRTIARVAQINFAPLVVAERFVQVVGALTNYAEQQAALRERQYGDLDPTKEAEGIKNAFTDVIGMLQSVNGGS